jgi:hypothetical protein
MIWKLGLVALALAGLALVLAHKGIPRVWAGTGSEGKPVLITAAIDESQLIRLRGNTRPEANAKNDRGRVEDSFPMEHMLLQLKRAPELEREFDQYIDSLTDKSSPNFRHWMLAAEQGEKYGLAQQDIDSITGWLGSHGFSVGYVYPNLMVIDFSGTAGQIREAFHTEIHYLEVGGEQHFANMSDPKIPAALAPALVGVVSMHNFKPQQMRVPRVRKNYTFSGCTNGINGTGGNCYALVPADFQTIYNLNPLYQQGINGTGQTITVVEDSNTYGTDVATYRSTFLSKWSGTVTTTHPTGGTCSNPGTNAADGEADLDAEVASAIAPNATIVVATCADTTTFGGLLAIENLVTSATPPAIISMSYGECEAFNGATSNAAFSSAFQTGATAGTSIFVSSGDAGASGCANLFAETPANSYALSGVGITGWGETVYNVSVGGTDFEDAYNAKELGIPVSTYWNSTNTGTDGSAKSYIPEIPWNDSCAGYLLYNYEGATTGYGSSGECATAAFRSIAAAAGGPSGCATGGGGTDQTSSAVVDGTCAGYAKPSWQSGIFGNPADGVRDIPDVSLFASNGIWGHFATICFSDTTQGGKSCAGLPSTWSGFGGTSVSAPMMAAIQALVNEKWNIRTGNPNPTYYSIANSEFGASGDSSCYSINQPPRRGLASSCAFYDITQGDNVIDCRYNGPNEVGCYLPSGTYGSLSTQALASVTVTAGGSGYTSAPTCTLSAPAATSPYLNPAGGTIYAGGTQATGTCTASLGSTTAAGTLVVSGTVATSWAGATFTVGSTTYTFVNGTPAAVNQVELHTSNNAGTNRTDTAMNIEAVIDAVTGDCADSGCVHAGQTANSAVTATRSTNTVTLTAKTVGAAGNFTLNSTESGVVATITTVGLGPYVSAISGPTGGIAPGGVGYAGGSGCTLTGGGGSGATCAAQVLITTTPASYQPAFYATPGWDFATGIGSVNAYNLVFNSAW